MPEPIEVIQLLRFPRDHLFSIERVFKAVRSRFPPDINAHEWHCRHHPNSSLVGRVRDAWAARSLKADVLHITGDAHYLAWFLRRRSLVLTIHDTESLDRMRGPKKWIFRLLWFTIPVARSAALVVISKATKDAVARHVSLRGKRVAVIPDPCTMTVPRKTAVFADRPIVLHVGTKANKNLSRHIEAIKGLDVQLLVVGILSEQQRDCLERSGLRWENRHGLSDQALAATYGEADLLLFASLTEGFGLPILEAQMAGIPVVTSNRSSMPEAAGAGALLVDPESVEDIRSAVCSLLDDPELRKRTIARGFENVDRFAPEKIAAQYAEVYRALITEEIV